MSNVLYKFGEYIINVKENNLWRGDDLVMLPPKVFATLLELVAAEGDVVSKDELLARVWSDAFVEESNLSQNIYLLRQTFGKENTFIETVRGRGYRFAVPVEKIGDKDHAAIANTAVVAELPLNNPDNPPKKEKRFVFAAITSALIMVAVFAGIGMIGRNEPGPERLEIKKFTDTGNVYSSVISPNGKYIAYVKTEDGPPAIHLMDIAAERTLAVPIEANVTPGAIVFMPSGDEILFRGRALWRSAEKIYRMSYFGGSPAVIAQDAWGRFSISPDGRRIAFFREDTATNTDLLMIKDLATGEETKALELPAPEQFFLLVAAAWSPDGERLAYVRRNSSGGRNQIDTLDVSSGVVTTVTTPLDKIFQMVWRPDGRSLLALSKEPGKGRQIWDVSFPDGKTTRVTNDLNMYSELSISQDGRSFVTQVEDLTSNVWHHEIIPAGRARELTVGTYGHNALGDLIHLTSGTVVFDARSDVERDLWSVDIETRKQNRITQNNGTRNSQISADSEGKFIYAASNRDGTESIWRLGVGTGGEAAKLTDASDEAHWFPALSHDERSLYYLARRKGSSEIRRLLLENNETETIYTIMDFSPLHFFRTSPDGRYLAFVIKKNDEGEPAENADVSDRLMPFRIGLLDLLSGELRSIDIRSSRALIRFTNGGNSIDYIRGGDIVRHSLRAADAEPEVVLSLPNERIFNFDWSSDESAVAVARGGFRSDIVLFNFR